MDSAGIEPAVSASFGRVGSLVSACEGGVLPLDYEPFLIRKDWLFSFFSAGRIFFLSVKKEKATALLPLDYEPFLIRKDWLFSFFCLGLLFNSILHFFLMDKKTLVAANIVVALALVYWFLQEIGFAQISAVLSRSRLEFVVLGALCYAGMNLLNSFRIAWALQTRWTLDLFFKHMTALLISDFTPGRAGYSSLVLKLRAAGFDSGRAIKALGVLFASDFVARALLAMLAAAFFAGKISAQIFLVVAAIMLSLGVSIFFLVALRSDVIVRFLPKLPVFGPRMAAAYKHALDSKASLGLLAGNVALSLVGAVLRGSGWMMVFLALGLGGVEVLPAATLVSALATALSFVPLSLAGLGLQDGAGAYLFTAATSVGLAQAAAVMLLARVMEFGVDAALGWRELLTDWRKAGGEYKKQR